MSRSDPIARPDEPSSHTSTDSPTDAVDTEGLGAELLDQIRFHWRHQIRARLDGLSDEEYLWEPVADSWNIRPRGSAGGAPVRAGSGAMTIDFAFPEPQPPPVTTIAWRIAHVIVGVLAMRNAAHFGAAEVDYQSYDYPATAAAALERLDEEYDRWIAGVESLGEEGLWRPVGDSEGDYAAKPYVTLVLHINRELIHHLAEVALLRDLFAHTHGAPVGS